MHSNITEQEIIQSIEDNISEKIKNYEETIKSKKDQEKNAKFFEKQAIKKTQEDCRKAIRGLSLLRRQFNDLYFNENEYFKLPEELKSEVENLLQYMTPEEARRIKDQVKTSVRGKNKEVDQKMEQQKKEIEKTLKQLGVSTLAVKDNFGRTKQQTSYQSALHELVNRKQNEQDLLMIKDQNQNQEKETELFDEIEKMIKNGKLEQNDKTKQIRSDFSNIKRAYIEKSKSDKAIQAMFELKQKLHNQVGVNYQGLIKELETISKAKAKQSAQLGKILEKANIPYLESQVEQYRKEQNKEYSEQLGKESYQIVAKQLEELQKTDPNDLKQIQELKRQLNEIAAKNNINDIEQMHLKDQVHQDIENEKFQKEADKEYIKKQYEERKYQLTPEEARDRQVQKMASYLVGDISGLSPKEQEMKQKEAMREVILISKMSPAERYIYYGKKNGKLPPDTVIEDLVASKDKEMHKENIKSYRDDEDMKQLKELQEEVAKSGRGR